MKLLHKYRSYTYLTLIIAVLVSAVIQFHMYRYTLNWTIDRVLYEYCYDIKDFAKEYGTVLPFSYIEMGLSTISLEINPQSLKGADGIIRDTLLHSHIDNQLVHYRKLVFPVITPENHYKVTLMLPSMEKHELIRLVVLSLSLILLLFVLFSVAADWNFSRRIFRPFHHILKVMKSYDLEKHTNIRLPDYNIDEFQELTTIVKGMMGKIDRDYNDMKNFLEETSHELQTPLSIIQLKLEMINQKADLDEETYGNLASISSAVNRIARFNRSLLLLAKINNDQFAQTRPVNLNRNIDQFFAFYGEIIEIRKIRIECNYQEELMVEMNPLLAEYFVQNILTNAVKHNFDQGTIFIETARNRMAVKNTYKGQPPAGNLFDKYNYSRNKADSSGLGLAIVKSIADKSHFSVSYAFEDNLFCIAMQCEKGTEDEKSRIGK